MNRSISSEFTDKFCVYYREPVGEDCRSAMKRILTVLLLLLSAIAFAISYVNTGAAQLSQMQNATTAVGQPFVISNDPRLADPGKMYSVLLSAALDTQVNVFRTSVGFTPENRPQVTQYILLTGGTHVFDAFRLKKGRWLTPADTQSTNQFLSTVGTKDPNEVGVLRDFGGDDLVKIRGLRDAFDSLPVAGQYIVESSNPSSFGRFLDLLAKKATQPNGDLAAPFSATDFKASQGAFQGVVERNYARLLNAVQYLIIFLTTMLLLYNLLHGAKSAGVMKLHGFGTMRVWYEVSGRLLLTVLSISALLSVFATSFVPDATAGFLVSVLTSLVSASLIMLGASLLTCLYIERIKVSDSVKNRKDIRGIFAVNTVIKTICSILLIVVGAGLWLQYSNVASEREKLGNWSKTRNYGLFYPTSLGNDVIEAQTGQPGPTVAEIYQLYPVLNKMGSLFIDSANYEPAALSAPSEPTYIRSLQVNPNYLKAFPLRDASGQIIDIPETTSDWIVLVPEKYQVRQREMLAYFQGGRTGSSTQEGAFQAAKVIFDREVPPSLIHQRVKIVWMANHQKVFSFSPLVFPSKNNVITDPVIQVMTSANSLGIDRANMMTGGVGSALKVRLVGGDTASTIKMLAPTLKSLRLDDNLRYLVTMDEYVLQQLQSLKEGIRNVTIAAIALGIGMLVLVTQNLAILFYRYSRKVVVRRLFGLRFRRTYREFLLVFATIWGFQLVGALAANRLGSSPFSTPTFSSVASDQVVLAIVAAIILVELVFSIGVLIFIEKRSLIRVLKGEF